jgi:hypothetical protein
MSNVVIDGYLDYLITLCRKKVEVSVITCFGVVHYGVYEKLTIRVSGNVGEIRTGSLLSKCRIRYRSAISCVVYDSVEKAVLLLSDTCSFAAMIIFQRQSTSYTHHNWRTPKDKLKVYKPINRIKDKDVAQFEFGTVHWRLNGGVEIDFHKFLVFALDGNKWSSSGSASFTPFKRAPVAFKQEG